MDKKIIIVLLLLIITSTLLEFKFGNFSLTPIQGNWENNDQILQIPAIYKISNDSLFANDAIIGEYINIYPTLLFSLTASLYTFTSDMMLTYFLLFLLLKTTFIFSVFLLSKHLLKKHSVALLATLFLSFTHFMGSDEIGLSEVVPKNFVFAFMPLVFWLFLKDRKKNWLPCFSILGLMAYFHLFSVMPILLLFSYSYLSKKEYTGFFKSVIVFSILILPFLIFTVQQPSGKIDPGILGVVPYANLANGFLTIIKYFPIILIGVVFAYKKNKEMFSWFIIIALYSLISLGGIFSEKILLLTFYRAFKYVIFFSFIFSAGFAYYLFKKNKPHFTLASAAFAAVILLYFSSIYYSTIFDGVTKNMATYSKDILDVIKLGNWLDSNLGRNETILIPPDWGVIRVWSKRSVVISNADYYILYFSSEKFPDRELYQNIESAFKSKDPDLIIKAAKKADTEYIITYNTTLNAAPIFIANRFVLYKI